ncbi:MAG: DUF3048 domain-containing protein [Acidimicrobiia bacterium]|nr:DUF3048 domain-containing protein [Acidimicrobiia bacterium]
MRPSHICLFAAFTIALGACSGANAVETTTTSTTVPSTTTTSTTRPPTTTTTTEPAGPVSPLNGLPADDPTLLERGVLAVKIDNHWNARPQSGIMEADAVYELLVEAGLTRFISLFHDNDSDYLGPMRSGRPTDPTLLKPLGAIFAISGAQDWVVSRIVGSGVHVIGEVRPATFRISSRSAPHNLYVDTAQLRDYAAGRGYESEPPADLFAWGDFEPTGTARHITLGFSPETTVVWDWDGERYVRTINGVEGQWMDKDGELGQISADTLVVLFARRYTSSPPAGTSGSSVPAMDTVGSGRALVFAGGGLVEGTWTRDDIDHMFELTGPDDDQLTVPPGIPWISVFPDSRTVSW